jgi:hypothetical protein
MIQKSTYYFHYDFACKKVPLSLRYANSIQRVTEISTLILTGNKTHQEQQLF